MPQARKITRSRPLINCVGGCDFPARPDRSALAQTVLWSPAVDPGVLSLAEVPATIAKAESMPALHFTVHRMTPSECHAVHSGADATQLVLPPDLRSDSSIAALIPLDADTPGRIEALSRLWRSWKGLSVQSDTRLTAQRRRRLRLMLRAADGRENAASYREIAQGLYGTSRVASEPWKTSPLRDTVIGLVEGASALIAGGYLQFLRHRRRS